MTRLVMLAAAAVSLTLVSCASSTKDGCSSCCEKPAAKKDCCDKGAAAKKDCCEKKH